jgi:YidC/Oxa1 family membrane protein insertase
VLNGIGKEPPQGKGRLSDTAAEQAADATIFGAPISDKFLGADDLTTQIVTLVLIVLMSATTFLTQKQLMSKNMPADAMNNPFAQQQKILLYAFPVIFAVTGVNFPIGVLLYWLTTNLWSMGQQFYVIRRNPAPGSPAFEALERRRAAKAAKHPAPPAAPSGNGSSAAADSPGTGAHAGAPGEQEAPGTNGSAGETGPGPRGRQRQQPKRKRKR